MSHGGVPPWELGSLIVIGMPVQDTESKSLEFDEFFTFFFICSFFLS